MIATHEMQYDQLMIGGFPVVMDAVTLMAGKAYKRGSVIAMVTAEKKGALVDSTKTDGSEIPYAVLAEDTDAANSDVVAPVYLSGEFNQDALIFGENDDASIHKAALRNINIYIKTVGN